MASIEAMIDIPGRGNTDTFKKGCTSTMFTISRETSHIPSTSSQSQPSPSSAVEYTPPFKKRADDFQWHLTDEIYTSPSFSSKTIGSMTAQLISIREETVAKTLYEALSAELQTEANKETIDDAVRTPLNMSGAIIMSIHTEQGLQLIAAKCERRKLQHHTNGTVEPGESLKQAAIREWGEELGNPPAGGILQGIIQDPRNCRSVVGTNKLGATVEDIAKKIANRGKKSVYLNASALYVNRKRVKHAKLEEEISTLNKRLKKANPSYDEATKLLYEDKKAGTKPADLSNADVQRQANAIIDTFKTKCPDIIPDHLRTCFSHQSHLTTPETIHASLHAIVDLAENKEIKLVSEPEYEKKIDLFRNNLKEFKEENFDSGFDTIFTHRGNQTTQGFFASLKSEKEAPAPSALSD